MDAESGLKGLLWRTAYTPTRSGGTDAAWAASEHASSTPLSSVRSRTTAMGLEAAGGAVEVVAAGGIGSEGARDEDFGKPIFWRSRVSNGVHGLSGRTGRRQRDRVRQNRIHLGNVATHECECMSMYENEGRVVPGTETVAGYSVSSASRTSVLRVGEPARGVMGGLVQPATPPVEPPVSSLSDPFTGPTTTAPAPIGVLARGVSPRTDAVQAA